MEEYPPMIMNTVWVLGADNVSPAEACTASECIHMLFYFKQALPRKLWAAQGRRGWLTALDKFWPDGRRNEQHFLSFGTKNCSVLHISCNRFWLSDHGLNSAREASHIIAAICLAFSSLDLLHGVRGLLVRKHETHGEKNMPMVLTWPFRYRLTK